MQRLPAGHGDQKKRALPGEGGQSRREQEGTGGNTTKGKRDIPRYIGHNLIYYRRKKGLTQEALCKALDLTRSTYAYYEIGRTLPTVMFLKRLAQYYEVTLDELLDESLEEQSESEMA